jgi:hypothetical protein
MDFTDQQAVLRNIVGLVNTCGPDADGNHPSYVMSHELAGHYRATLNMIRERAQKCIAATGKCGADDDGWLCNLDTGHDGSHAVIVVTEHGDDCAHAWD